MNFYVDDERNAALRGWVHGDHHAEAAVELLVWHRTPRLVEAGPGRVTGRVVFGRRIGLRSQGVPGGCSGGFSPTLARRCLADVR
jgi:hypothetical protein